MPRAVKGRGSPPPRYSHAVWKFMVTIGGAYLRLAEGVRSVSLTNPEVLQEGYRAFHQGEKRLILAFRHTAKEDAHVLTYALNVLLPRLSRKSGIAFPYHPHVRFLYGKDVLTWAGNAAAWLIPRIGGIPVRNRGANREGLSIIRSDAVSGPYPIALAPEGQVTYHMYRSAPGTGGTASIALWALESGKPVEIIPLALGYRWGSDPEAFIRRMLLRWESETGRTVSGTHLHEQLIEATDGTLDLLEEFYGIAKESSLEYRIAAVCERALASGEASAGIVASGTILDRLFRLRYTGVDRMFPDDFEPQKLPRITRSLKDFRAQEAAAFMRHAQIVDILEYLDPSYIDPPFSAGRGCEYVLNLLDIVNRMQGGNINTRFSPKGKTAMVLAGPPLDAGSLLSGGRGNRENRNLLNKAVENSLNRASQDLESIWEHSTLS